MNIRGQVVGSSDDCVETELHGFLWQQGGPMIDLNAFVPPDSELTITDGHTINESGEITASGMLPNGDFHAVLLIPCGPDETNGCHAFSRAETHIRRSLPAAPHRSAAPPDSFNSMHLLLGSRGWHANHRFGTIPRTSPL
jgi:probable HAF family extracellular repeat protein